MITDDVTRRLLEEIIEAHGGLALWNSLLAVEAEISAGGFLFTAKRRPLLRHVRMRAYTGEPRFTFYGYPRPGQTAELHGDAEVRIMGSDRRVVARREKPRTAFGGLSRLFSWDDLDFIYFAGYATWNYLTAPFLLTRQDFRIETLAPLSGELGRYTRLRATFPANLPTHSHQQIFYFDDQHLLRRLDYTAEVVGGWAHAAHLCEDYRDFGGLKIPTRRRVLPLPFGHKPLPFPTLVDITVHAVKLVP